MSFQFSLSSMQQIEPPLSEWENSHKAGSEMMIKQIGYTTCQDGARLNQNQPMVFNGVFWNVNHDMLNGPRNYDLMQLDSTFEGEILRDHLVVIKGALQKYMSEVCGEDASHIYDHCDIEDPEQHQYDTFKDPSRAVETFTQNLKDTKWFKEQQLVQLENILKADALLVRLFQVFGEAAPSQMKHTLRSLILKSLIFNQQFNLKQSSENDLIHLIEGHRQMIAREIDPSKPSEALKKLTQVVVYTVIMSANGLSTNKYTKQTNQNFMRLKQTKFQKVLNEIAKEKKKPTLVRRSTFDINQKSHMIAKRRNCSND